MKDGLAMRVELVLEYKHPIDGTQAQTYTGVFHAGMRFNPEWLEASDYEGWPKDSQRPKQ